MAVASWYDLLYGVLLYGYGQRRHRRLSATAPRTDHHTYTAFYRLPAQFDALLGPVLDHVGVGSDGRRTEPVRISVLAGSIGAEAYTIAGVLRRALPDLDFEIECSDLHPDTVDRAEAGVYQADEVLRHGIPAALVDALFVREGDTFTVRDDVRRSVRFFTADILDDGLAARHSRSDMVFVQNVFCHLTADQADVAFDNVLRILASPGALFVDGMPLDWRQRLTAAHDLRPLDFKLREIHAQARRHLPPAWWTRYYGVEPFVPIRRDRSRRYATIFLR
ncbi:MAG: CheR family methyltransferase [Acidimicrobiales bacterium]